MSKRPQKTLEPQSSECLDDDDDDDNEVEELDKLEADVNEMAQKIVQYRAELPDQLNNTLASILESQRPVVLTNSEVGSEPGTSGDPNPDAGDPLESGNRALLVVEEEDQETAEKTKLLSQKRSSNASAMSIVKKRMKDCISRIDNLDSGDGIIHPAFKMKHTR